MILNICHETKNTLHVNHSVSRLCSGICKCLLAVGRRGASPVLCTHMKALAQTYIQLCIPDGQKAGMAPKVTVPTTCLGSEVKQQFCQAGEEAVLVKFIQGRDEAEHLLH